VVRGRWFLDGHLLAMRFSADGDRVRSAFRTSLGGLVLNQELLMRP
jgi:hypothetical protein